MESLLSAAGHTPPAIPAAQRAFPYDPARVKVIACATVIEEMHAYMPPEMASEVLDFGLHLHPGDLTGALQAAIDASTGFDTILLGYGLCSTRTSCLPDCSVATRAARRPRSCGAGTVKSSSPNRSMSAWSASKRC